MVKFQLSGTQVRAFTFLLACILALCVFAVLPVDITYLDYVGSLTYPTIGSNPCKNSHATYENNLISEVVKISRIGQN